MACIIAGERSGSGKTTVTLALLAALAARSRGDRATSVQSFKVGPDYIDPMFHTAITGRPCRNLDPVLTSETYVQSCFATHSDRADYALVEGVMGLFDGASGQTDVASTAHIARLLDLPVILVIDGRHLSRSVAAIAHGYATFDPRVRLAGVVLNRVGSDRHVELLTTALAAIAMPILGILRRQDEITIPDRHLGLVPTEELTGWTELSDRLTHLGQTHFDWEQLEPLLQGGGAGVRSHRMTPTPAPAPPLDPRPPRIAIARDRAFSFYYADNCEYLAHLGAELVPWSPLSEPTLPADIQGLYLGGGFPEVFAAELAANRPARLAVHQAIQAGLPTYAECGGLMYLSQSIQDVQGQHHPMVGALPTAAHMGDRLTLGYRGATLRQSGFVTRPQDVIWGHEFHRSHLTTAAPTPLWQLRRYDPAIDLGGEGWGTATLHASYVHLHWGGCPAIAARFITQCRNYKQHDQSG